MRNDKDAPPIELRPLSPSSRVSPAVRLSHLPSSPQTSFYRLSQPSRKIKPFPSQEEARRAPPSSFDPPSNAISSFSAFRPASFPSTAQMAFNSSATSESFKYSTTLLPSSSSPTHPAATPTSSRPPSTFLFTSSTLPAQAALPPCSLPPPLPPCLP